MPELIDTSTAKYMYCFSSYFACDIGVPISLPPCSCFTRNISNDVVDASSSGQASSEIWQKTIYFKTEL